MGGSGERIGGLGKEWGGLGKEWGGRQGPVSETSGMCPKSCKCFGVKNARGENLWEKSDGGSGERVGGSGKRVHFVGEK